MHAQAPMLLGLAAMVVVSLLIGTLTPKRNTSLVAFFWGDGKMRKPRLIDLLLSNPLSMNGILYQAWLGYVAGWSAVFIQVIWCISYILLATRQSRLQQIVHEETLHGNIGTVFGIKAAKAAAVASIVGFTLQVGWELIVGVSVFKPLGFSTALQQGILVSSLALIGAVYTIVGGLRGNAIVNTVQNRTVSACLWGLIAFLAFWGIHPAQVSGNGLWPVNSFSLLIKELTILGLITNLIFSLVWQFVDMSTWQILAASNRGEEKAVLYKGAWKIFLYPGVTGTLVGVFLRNIPKLSSDDILSSLFIHLADYPWICFLLVAAFVAAMLSTIDGLMLAASQAATWDLFNHQEVEEIRKHEILRRQGAPISVANENKIAEMEDSIMSKVRLWILALAIAGGAVMYSILTALNLNIFELVYIVVIAQMVLLPVILVVLAGKKTKLRNGATSIWLGLGTASATVIVAIVLTRVGVLKDASVLLTCTPLIGLSIAAAPILYALYKER